MSRAKATQAGRCSARHWFLPWSFQWLCQHLAVKLGSDRDPLPLIRALTENGAEARAEPSDSLPCDSRQPNILRSGKDKFVLPRGNWLLSINVPFCISVFPMQTGIRWEKISDILKKKWKHWKKYIPLLAICWTIDIFKSENVICITYLSHTKYHRGYL